MPKFNERGIIHLLLLLILLLGIAGGVLLVTRGEPLKLLPKAFAPKDQITTLTDQLLKASGEYNLTFKPARVASQTEQPAVGFTLLLQETVYSVGDEIAVQLIVHADTEAANLFSAKLKYDPDLVSFDKADTTSSFIKNWVEQNWKTPGEISLVGAVPNPGLQTKKEDTPLMAILYFKALKTGSAAVSLTDESAIYSNLSNTNILVSKNDATINIGVVSPTLDNMVSIAKERKELLLKKIKDNPQEFLDQAILADKTDQFPEAVKPYLEEKIEISGQLGVVHADDFTSNKSTYEYFLQVKREEKLANSYQLHFVKDAPQVLSGAEVKIAGTKLEKQVVLGGGCCQILTPPGPPDYQKQITAVLLVNFADNANYKPLQAEKVRDMLFNTSQYNSANTYFRDNSYNKVHLNGNTYGWYTIDVGQCGNSDILRFADQANAAFTKELGKPIGQVYRRVIYAFSDSRCGNSGGWGTFGEWKMPDGSYFSMSWIFSHNVRVYEHEIGHNLGVHHANKYDCAVGTYTNCSESEYGDIYDIMGNFGLLNNNDSLHFNAPHKIALGWLGEGEIQTVTKNNIYTIRGLEDPNPGVKVLKIKKPDTDEFYYVSYRQRNSANRNSFGLHQELINGASIHIWDGNPLRQTKFITAIYSGFSDLALADGKVFYDKISKIQIKQISHVVSREELPGSVTLAVEFNASPPPTPTSSPRPTSSPVSAPITLPSAPTPDRCAGIGDVNLDGKINATDSLVVLRINAGYIKPADEQKRRADVNGDGKITSTDSLLILRYNAGFIKTFPVCL